MKKYFLLAAVAILALTACGGKKASANKDNATDQTKAALVSSTDEGAMFTDFQATQPDGSVLKLSDFVGKGKYVLVDFWASWCGPCRGEIPNLIKVYNKYKGNKFDVLGVAVWDEPDDSKQAIADMGINYPQILNAQEDATKTYGILGIPEIILFAPDGTILRRSLRGPQVEEAVKECLKK